MKKRPEFQTLDAAKAYILQKEAGLAKLLSVGKRASGDKPFNPDAITDAEGDPEGSDTKGEVDALKAENAKLKARIADLEEQLKAAKKALPKADSDDESSDGEDPDSKDTFSKTGITERSLKLAISTETDYRKVWAAQRALDAIQTARVNSAAYRKARK
jgi:hypothetical protein